MEKSRFMPALSKTAIGIGWGVMLTIASFEFQKRAGLTDPMLCFVLGMLPTALGFLIAGFSFKEKKFNPWTAVAAGLVLFICSFFLALAYA